MSDEFSQFIVFAHDLQTVRMLSLGSLAVLLYDIIMKLPDEVEYMWRARWGGFKFLYFASRYPIVGNFIIWTIYSMGFNGEILNLLGTVHLFACSKTDDRPLSCLRANYYVAWAQWLYCIPFQLVLFLRVLAVWESDRKVAGILAIVASVYYSSMIAIGVILTKSFRRPEPLEALVTESLQECFTSLPGTFLRLARFAYGLCLLSDGVMFTLILVKAIITERRARARLLSYLLRDGSVYYTVLFALSIGSVSMAVILPAERVILALSFSTAIFVAQSIGASHILLYLRKYSTEEQIQTVSGMQFADRRTIMDELSRQMVFDIPDGSDIDDRTDE